MRVILAMQKRKRQNAILSVFATAFTIFGLGVLGWILFSVFKNALPAISPELFTKPSAFNGLANLILGQLELVIFAGLVSIFLGLLGGVWLSLMKDFSKFAKLVSVANETLMSVPSIVVGVFIYAVVVVPSGNFSGFAGSLALAFMMLCLILKISCDTLNLIPNELKEAAFALGANRTQVVFNVLFMAVKNALISGIILALARVAGESAPLLYTNANNDFFAFNLGSSLPSLSVSVYDFSQMPGEQNAVAWAGAAILSGFILIVNILAKIFGSKNGTRN